MDYTYGRIDRLHASLVKNGIDPEIIAKIMEHGETITPGSSNEEKAGWFVMSMKKMDAMIDEGIRHRIREECACCLGGERLKIVKKIFKENDRYEKRILAANAAKKVFGNGVAEKDDKSIEVTFFDENDPKRRCPCLPGAREAMPITYCYCCGGHVKHHAQIALGKKFTVEVVTSVLSSQGKNICRFRLREIP